MEEEKLTIDQKLRILDIASDLATYEDETGSVATIYKELLTLLMEGN